MENPEGWGGHHFFQKTENPGRRGVPNEIPSVVGVWIFSGTAHCVNWYEHRKAQENKLFSIFMLVLVLISEALVHICHKYEPV